MKLILVPIILSLVWILASILVVYRRAQSQYHSGIHASNLYVRKQVRTLYSDDADIQKERNMIIKEICDSTTYPRLDQIFR